MLLLITPNVKNSRILSAKHAIVSKGALDQIWKSFSTSPGPQKEVWKVSYQAKQILIKYVIKKWLSEKIKDKIVERIFRHYVKWRSMVKVQYLLLNNFEKLILKQEKF